MMDGKLITVNGQTVFVYFAEDRGVVDVISMHDLSHRLQTILNGIDVVQVFDNPKEVITIAIAIVDQLQANPPAE